MSSAFAATTPRGIKRSDEQSVERLSLQIVGSPDPVVAELTSRLEPALGPAAPALLPLIVPVVAEFLGEGGPAPTGAVGRRLLNAKEAADSLGIGLTTTKRYIANGRLKSVTIGRRRLVPVAAVDAFVAELSADADAS